MQSQIKNARKIYDTSSLIFNNFYSSRGIAPKSFNISRVSEDFVYKELCNLDTINKSTGIGGIKSKFYPIPVYGPIRELYLLGLNSQFIPFKGPIHPSNTALWLVSYSIYCSLIGPGPQGQSGPHDHWVNLVPMTTTWSV